MVPTLLGITLVVFFGMKTAPGADPTARMAAESGAMRPAEREALRRYYNQQYGLDKPIWVQYLRWLNQVSPIGLKVDDQGHFGRPHFKVPNLGQSFPRKRPALDVILEAMPVTIILNLLSLPIIYGIAIVTGIYAARYRGKSFDVGTGTFFLALWSIPTMWAGVMAIGFLANRDYFYWFPTGGLHDLLSENMAFLPQWTSAGFQRGWLLDSLAHLTLPVLCMSYGGYAFLSKLMRSAVLENLTADFARTARAKGLPDRTVLFRHVLSNSILPLITVAASVLPALLGGSIIIETIFSINGMGRLMYQAALMQDQELILSETLVGSALSLVSLLIADICYAIADPRVSYE